MKKFLWLTLLLAVVLGSFSLAQASTEVKMVGDARIWGNFWSNINYTGWNFNGKQTGDPLTIWERFRLRTDFIANEGLKFRLGIRVNNKAWGNYTYTVDNPTVSIDVYQAFLQFKWPGTDVEFTIGMQDWNLPVSNEMFNANVVFGGLRSAAAIVSIPLAEQIKVVGGFSRFLDTNKDFDPTTTQVADEFDGYFLSLPVTLDGFQFTPWGMMGVTGSSANYAGTFIGNSPRTSNQNLANNLFSAASKLAPATFRNNQNLYWWAGAAASVTALDPFKFYADVIYGQGNASDRGKNLRGGLFFDVAAEYTGLDVLTPQLTFWYATGEDSSTRNGSERMPTVAGTWGPSTSFLFDNNQAYGAGHMGLNPVGSWGVAASLNKISFIQDLSHRLTFTFAQGTNSPRALRQGNIIWGVGNFFQMGRDLASNEQVYGVNFDNQYNIYENLAAIVETGWAHGNFHTSVWTHSFTTQARNGDAWKVAFGLQYKF